MRRFAAFTDAQFECLRADAARADVQYRRAELPSGVSQERGRIGFRVTDGRAAALIERGLRYDGGDAQIAAWVHRGELWFPSFAALAAWLRQGVQSQMRGGARPSQASPPRRAAALTDLDEVGETVARSLRDRRELLDLDVLINEVATRVVHQDAAVRLVCGVAARHAAKVQPARPATMFLVGPTGVGKTATVQALAAALGGSGGVPSAQSTTGAPRVSETGTADTPVGYGFVRIDLSEYQESHRVAQLLGAPPGYIGHDRPAPLPEALAANPRTVVLFDEVDKAHDNVLVAIMNMLDAGRLSTPTPVGPNQAHDIDCRHAIFCFTTNAASASIGSDVAARSDNGSQTVVDHVCRRRLLAAGVKPEVVARIRAFALFTPLSRHARAEIAVMSICRVGEEYGLDVRYVEPAVVASVVGLMDDGRMGARVDEYAVDALLGDAFARAVSGGCSKVRVVIGPDTDPVCVALDTSLG